MIGPNRQIRARCVVDIEQTPESLHAHAIPLDVAIRPGDRVVLHDPPTSIGYNQRLTRECRATVHRAGPFRRAWTRAGALFALLDLYEVGFDAGNAT